MPFRRTSIDSSQRTGFYSPKRSRVVGSRIAYSISPDPDAEAYLLAVEVADGEALEAGVVNAVTDFVVGCKSDGIWDAIKASCILAGARTLNGALVPLVGTAPTNNNFVSGDYSRTTGLVGDGSTKYLNSNRSDNADPQNSHHLGSYCSEAPTSGDYPNIFSSTLYGTTGATQLYRRRVSGDRWEAQSRNSTAQTSTSLTGTAASFVGLSRSSSSQCVIRANGISGVNSITSQLPGSTTTKVFAYGTFVNFNGRIAFYSIGESLDLALLDNRVTVLMSGIQNAIP